MSRGGIKVLLVDDDELAYQLVGIYLSEARDEPFELEWKSDYDSGLAAIDARTHDVCLLDFHLGNRNGLDFLKEVIRRGCRVPIVVFTARGDNGLDLEAMRQGAADYLVKGEFGPPLLERCLRYAVERSRTLEQLRESEERYALSVAGARDGLWDWKLPGEHVYLSPRWKSILGFDEQELPNLLDEWLLRVHPEDVERVRADIQQHLEGKSEHFENEHRILHKDGTFRWVLSRGVAVRDRDGIPTRFAGSQSDVTQSRGHDPLTKLPNRVLYLDRVARVLERAKRRSLYNYAVLFLDLDRFKIINDSLGHVMGDELLIGIAARLMSCMRVVDTVARLGGDEFTVLLEDIEEPSDATRVATRIQQALSLPFTLGGREVFTSASIGIAMGGPDYQQPEELLRDADTAMYRAKGEGKARHEIFDRGMHAKAIALLQVETELRQAVELGNFKVFYQPIISLESGRIVSVEALVRWLHPTRGIVQPDEFIGVAEETGLIVKIDRFVLNQACLQLSTWQARFGTETPLGMAVNVSKRQLAQADFVEQIEAVLSRTGIQPQSLCLEITESAIMENATLATAKLDRLRKLHVQLAMDDFGTGYSSLSYLHRFPFTALKIDRSFVNQIGTGAGTTEIVRAIVTLARNLKVSVTAEGVETNEQLEHLRKLGCTHAQGFLISRPVDAPAFEALLAQGLRL